jgi:hypothetical protein
MIRRAALPAPFVLAPCTYRQAEVIMGQLQDHAKQTNQLVISYRNLQRMLGILGLALPISLLIFTLVEGRELEASISDFYYTKMGGVLVGTLCAVGVFLFCYNGYPEDHPNPTLWQRFFTDRTFATAAGVFAIGVALFPVHREGLIPPTQFIDLTAGDTQSVYFSAIRHPDAFHYGSAALFFVCIFIFSAVFFPRGEKTMTKRKIIYYLCAAAMLLSIAVMGVYWIAKDSLTFGKHFLFIWESVAVVAFSVAWLAKGKSEEPIVKGMNRLKVKAS